MQNWKEVCLEAGHEWSQGRHLATGQGQHVPVHRSSYTKCTPHDGESSLWDQQREVVVELPQSRIPGLEGKELAQVSGASPFKALYTRTTVLKILQWLTCREPVQGFHHSGDVIPCTCQCY